MTIQLNGKTFEEKLQMWTKEVLDYCCPMAEKHNRAFYAFQSAPKENPKILLLGLNPGGDYWYETKMTLETFTEQNSFYFGGKNYNPKTKWNILEKLKKTIEVNEELKQEFSDMLYMNLLYFNSKDFGDFQRSFKENWREIFDKCTEFTRFLIAEIIKPDKIVCLGAHCFPKLVGKNTQSRNDVKMAYLNEIPVYGIPHPSARLSNARREFIGKELAKLWFDDKQ